MACLYNCKYCGGRVWNYPWHDDCRLALAEGLLAQIKEFVGSKTATGQALPGNVLDQVLSENWRKLPIKKTLEEIFKEGLGIPETLLESRR